ncbi:XRE family transcriptional regulator, partial [Glaesserella parasuis]
MSTLGERIEQAMNLKGLKRKELAEMLNISTMAVGDLINNKTKKPRYLIEIAEALNVDVKWLQTGEGEMRSHVNDVDVIDKDKDYSNTHINIDMYDIKLSAGNGKPVIEWVPRKSDEPLLFREAWFKVKRLSPKNCKAMYVRGHSMAPVLEDWDTVIVDISDTEIADGEVYAVVYNKHFYIKQIIRTGKGIQLVSFNPEYYPI